MNSAPKIGKLAPKMGATPLLSTISSALFGKTRRAVLALLYSHPDRQFGMREIATAAGAGQGSAQRELRRLTKAGILLRQVEGKRVYYQANRDCPVFAELQSLMVKTTGVADVLRTALAGLADRIHVAFIYGSVANGSFRATSDVDVLIVGAVTFAEAVSVLSPTQEKLRREVNPSVYPSEEFRRKLRGGNHFLTAVIREPKVFLIGGEHELAELAEERLAV